MEYEMVFIYLYNLNNQHHEWHMKSWFHKYNNQWMEFIWYKVECKSYLKIYLSMKNYLYNLNNQHHEWHMKSWFHKYNNQWMEFIWYKVECKSYLKRFCTSFMNWFIQKCLSTIKVFTTYMKCTSWTLFYNLSR